MKAIGTATVGGSGVTNPYFLEKEYMLKVGAWMTTMCIN